MKKIKRFLPVVTFLELCHAENITLNNIFWAQAVLKFVNVCAPLPIHVKYSYHWEHYILFIVNTGKEFTKWWIIPDTLCPVQCQAVRYASPLYKFRMVLLQCLTCSFPWKIIQMASKYLVNKKQFNLVMAIYILQAESDRRILKTIR